MSDRGSGRRRSGCSLVGLAGSVLAVAISACSAAPADPAGRSGGATGSGLGISLGTSFDNGKFKRSSTCDDPAHDYSPELMFEGAGGAESLALTMVDLDDGKVHWVQTGIPGDATGLQEHMLVRGAREWVNDLGEATYDGPCPPPGERHRYRMTLYALPVSAHLGSAASPAAAVQQLERFATDRATVEASYTGAP